MGSKSTIWTTSALCVESVHLCVGRGALSLSGEKRGFDLPKRDEFLGALLPPEADLQSWLPGLHRVQRHNGHTDAGANPGRYRPGYVF